MLNGPFTEVKTNGPAGADADSSVDDRAAGTGHVDMKDTDTPALARVDGAKEQSRGFRGISAGFTTATACRRMRAVSGCPRATSFRSGSFGRDAHPLVEISLMRQSGRTLLHVIN